MDVDIIRQSLRHFGVGKTIYNLSFRLLNRIILFKILKGMHTTSTNVDYLKLDKKYSHGFLSEEILRLFADKQEYELSHSFIDQALKKGDECYGIFDGEILVYYGWYSNKPTQLDPPELVIHFNRRYVYMYKAFTSIKYRGQRLHPVGLNLALEHYLNRGYKGLIAYADSHNFSSLAAGYKMGHKNFGNIYLFQISNRYFSFSDKGCKQFDFRLEYVQENMGLGYAHARKLM